MLLLAVATTIFERQAFSPLLKPIASDFRVSIASVALAATAFLVLYGIAQPVTGVLSDMLGRVPMMRLAIAGSALAAALSALAPTPGWLIAARGFAGAMNAAIFPTALVYVAETTAFNVRQREVVKLTAATSTATAVSVLTAGALAALASWRLVFAIPALTFALLAIRMGRLPEPSRIPSARPAHQLLVVLRRPWPLAVMVLAFFEGVAVFGALYYFAPMLEVRGVNPAIAGATFAAYGVATLASVPLLRLVSPRVAPAVLLVAGGAGTAAAYALLTVEQTVAGVVVASACAGFGFTMMHTTVQTWATEVAPDARGTAVALFACLLFLGGGAGTAALAPLAGAGNFRLLFGVALGLTVPVVAALAIARTRFHPAAAPAEMHSVAAS